MKNSKSVKVLNVSLIFMFFLAYHCAVNTLSRENIGKVAEIPATFPDTVDAVETDAEEKVDTSKLPDNILEGLESGVLSLPDPGQQIEPFFKFEYEGATFVDDNIFKLIKGEYSKIDFYGVFQEGDIENYDFYREKFNKLLNEKATFFDRTTGKEFFLSEFGIFSIDDRTGIYDLNNYVYYFFDMNEDGAPELCVTNNASFTYIFSYNAESDDFILWYEMYNGYYRLNGSRKVRYNRLGDQHGFYTLNEEGDIIEAVRFLNFYQTREIYMVYLPKYANKDKELEITGMTAEMKNQGFFEVYDKNYSFRVTKEQYYELTKHYFEAEREAEENLEDLAFSYEELFGATY